MALEINLRRDRKYFSWTVSLQNGVIVKEFKVLSLRRIWKSPWRREHAALAQLNRLGVPAPRTLGYHSPSRGVVVYKREFVDGEMPAKLDAKHIRQFASYLSKVHAARVVNLDLHLENFLITNSNELIMIDFGRAKVFRRKGVLYYYLGRELAGARKTLFPLKEEDWKLFLDAYREVAEYTAVEWGVIRLATAYWLRRWGFEPGSAKYI